MYDNSSAWSSSENTRGSPLPAYCFHSSGGEVPHLDRGSVVEGACLLAGWSHPASWPGTMLTWVRLSQEFSPTNRLQVVSLVTITSRPR